MALEESILTSVKKLLGLPEDYEDFDQDVLMHINSAFSTLNQLGVGPVDSLYVEDKTTLWSAFTAEEKNVASVRQYVYISVRLVFDPPATSFAIDSLTKLKTELEWRLNVVMEGVRHPIPEVIS